MAESFEGFKLSPGQHRVWDLQEGTGATAYKVRNAVEIFGPVDVSSLWEAVNRVVTDFEILRTTFRRVRGVRMPLQVISASPRFDFEVHSEVTAGPDDFISGLPDQPFDFERGPLLRVHVAKLASGGHLLAMEAPAMCADRASLTILTAEIARTCARDTTRAAGCAPIQYADYAEWQNELLAAETDFTFWLDQRAAAGHANIPYMRRDVPCTAFTSRALSIPISSGVSGPLLDLARACGVQVPIVVLSAWYVLLSRLTGRREIMTTISRDGRDYPELQGSVGLFEKHLPMRQSIDADATFVQVVAQVAGALCDFNNARDSFAWSRVPPQQTTPAFAPFAFEEHAPPASGRSTDVGFRVAAERSCTDRFELKLTCMQDGAALNLGLEANREAVDDDLFLRVAERVSALVNSAAVQPHAPVGSLEVVGPRERNELLRDWNDTRAPFPCGMLVHELIAEQAAASPDEPAVVVGTDAMSFRSLDERATTLAAFLQQSGVGPGSVVGILIERCPDLLVALIGVLKAGGAFLPLDPTYPPARLQFMAEDSAARFIITREPFVDLVPYGTRVIVIDRDWQAISGEGSALALSSLSEPDDLAYVIYTSGSTGTPKGAALHHRGLMNYLHWCLQAYDVRAGRGALVHSSISFDLTITGLFAPLLAGRSVILVPEELGLDGLAQCLVREDNLSFVKLTPSHLRILASRLPPESAAGRTRVLIAGGENLLANTIAFWRQHAPGTRIFNEYGPTETVVGCCVYEVGRQTASTGAIPIGRPIANTKLFVLDAWMHPVPVGVPGELFIGGDGVARGYLNRQDLTAARFVKNPFGGDPEDRLYRSGDLVRYERDGTLVFLGRIDDQIKLRGFRVEPGEIEGRLSAHPGVATAVVALKPSPSGELRLIGYLVPRSGTDAQANDNLVRQVRRSIEDTLPEYMQPAAYVVLDRLPLSPNGKLDRDSLPSPPERPAPTSSPRTTARNEMERLLIEIWQQVLKVSPVGLDDDFFALGGDSILCFQVIHKAQQAGLRITLQQIYRDRTIAALAPVVECVPVAAKSPEPAPGGPLPLTPIQRWFFDQHLPKPQHYNQAIVLEIDEHLDPSALEQAMRTLVSHHDALQLRFVESPGGWNQYVATGHSALLEVVRLAGLPPKERDRLFEERARSLQSRCDLGIGPLLRAALFDDGEEDSQRLLLVVHHLAVDAVSWRILLEDLHTAYLQASAGEVPRLPPRTASFARCAEFLAETARDRRVAAEVDFWLSAVESATPLPLDRNEGRNDFGSAESVSVALTPEETSRAGAIGADLSSVLLAAASIAVGQWTGSRTINVDLERHGRDGLLSDLDTSRTLGWFTVIHPVSIPLSAPMEPTVVARTLRQRLQAVPSAGQGFGLLRYLREETAPIMKALPRPELLFNHLGNFDSALPGTGPFRFGSGDPGPTVDPNAPRPYLIEILSRIFEGRLEFTFLYSRNRHEQKTIHLLADRLMEALRVVLTGRGIERGGAVSSGRTVDMVLTGLQTGGTGRPLFCFHPSGGMGTVYSELARSIGRSQPVYCFQSIGWYPGHEPDASVERMVARYIEALQTVQPEGPYLFAGWSAGAILAFEMARQLRGRSEQTALLAAIDQGPPSPDSAQQTDLMLLESMLGNCAPGLREQLRALEPEHQLVFALERAKAIGLVPLGADILQARRFLHIFRVTHDAIRNYRPRQYEGGMILFRAREQPATGWASDLDFGWSRWVRGGVEVQTVPGNHDTVIAEPNVRELGSRLRAQIDSHRSAFSARAT